MPGMQRLRSCSFCNSNDTQRIEVAFARCVATDANELIPSFAEQLRGRRVHVGVGLRENHFQVVFLRFSDNLFRSTPTGVTISTRLNGVTDHGPRALVSAASVLRPSVQFQDARTRSITSSTVSRGTGMTGIDRAENAVEFPVNRVLRPSPHRTRLHAEVIRQGGHVRQVLGDYDLPGEGHVRAGKIVSLHQRMCDEAGLRAAGTIAKAKAQYRLARFADEARDPVVHNGHQESAPAPSLVCMPPEEMNAITGMCRCAH